jgi:hypothetical protein
MKPKNIFFALSFIIVINYVFLSISVNANELVSKDKTLSIIINDGSLLSSRCNPSTKIGSYTKVNGSAGDLYIDCKSNKRGVDIMFYKFVDNVGLNRCLGRMAINFVGGRENLTIASWYFDGKVRGYNCPNAGKTLEFELR